jgi:F0F1-type ATP synthase membrane subunit b/b'
VVQIITFVLLWQGLRRLLFEPAQLVLDERHSRTVGLREEVGSLEAAAAAAGDDYTAQLRGARETVARDTEAGRADQRAAEAKILTAARERGAERLALQRAELNAQADVARTALAAEAAALGDQVFERVVGKSAS